MVIWLANYNKNGNLLYKKKNFEKMPNSHKQELLLTTAIH